MTGASHAEPLQALREYRNLAPWNLRDLASLVGAVLDASAITPINAAARAQPSERTIRFYVTKGLVSPPEGRGTAATYSYRHFLQLLWIKLRQMEGTTLATIIKEMHDQTGDVLERRAAQALGASLPVPDRLALKTKGTPPRGKSGRALTAWLTRDAERDPESPSSWHRIPVGRGVAARRDGPSPRAARPRGRDGRRSRAAGARETPPLGQRVGSITSERSYSWARSFFWFSWWSWWRG